MNSRIDVTAAQKSVLRRAVRAGQYNLLFGAGASLESIGQDGNSLPNGRGLQKKIAEHFQVPTDESDNLWNVYDRAVNKAGEEKVYLYLKQTFDKVQPPEWMTYYSRANWSTVWTLCLDESFEIAFNDDATEDSKRVKSYSWDDPYEKSVDLNVVHLHGKVDTDDTRKLVFSLPEYYTTIKNDAAWSATFRDTFGYQPFVIVGASLKDEPDLQGIMKANKPSHEAPSFYVSPHIGDTMKEDLASWGLLPVEMTADEFILEWEELTASKLDRPVPRRLAARYEIDRQFVDLSSATEPKSAVAKHDFLGGDNPELSDVTDGLVTEFAWMEDIRSKIKNVGSTIPASSLLVYTGRRLTGRSAGVYATAKYLQENSFIPFLFKGLGRLNINAILDYAEVRNGLALLFDGVTDCIDDVDTLITRAREEKVEVLCVALDDSHMEQRIGGRVKRDNLAGGKIYRGPNKLSQSDAARLVDKLDSVGRLGMLTDKNDRLRRQHFSGRDIFDSMAELEDAPGFGKRVEVLIDGIDDPVLLEAILFSAYASYVEKPLTIMDLARLLQMSSSKLHSLILEDKTLRVFLQTNGQTVTTRHRWKALSPVISKIGSETAALIVRDGILNLEPRVNLHSLRQRDAAPILVGAMMTWKNLDRFFPDTDLEDWYKSLERMFGDWNGRFWEQRAILAREKSVSDVTLLSRAESYARKAVSIRNDTYSLTTLGTVLLVKAARSEVDIKKYYSEALSKMESAGRLDFRGDANVTWFAFLRGALPVLDRLHERVSNFSDDVAAKSLYEQIAEDWVARYEGLEDVVRVSDDARDTLNSLRIKFSKRHSVSSGQISFIEKGVVN